LNTDSEFYDFAIDNINAYLGEHSKEINQAMDVFFIIKLIIIDYFSGFKCTY